MHPSQHQSRYYPGQLATQYGAQIPGSKAPWGASTPTTTTPDPSFQTYTVSHTLQRPQPHLSSPYSHGSDTTGSGGALRPASTIWTPGPGLSDTSNPPYQPSMSLSQIYPPTHLTSGAGHLIAPNPAQSALPHPPFPPRAMDANQYALQSGGGGGSGSGSGGGVLRNQGGRPSSSAVTRPVAAHLYVAHSQGAPSYGTRARPPGALTGRRHPGSRTGKAEDGSEEEYGESDVDLEGPMKRTDGHNLSTHERRRLYVSALETYITDTTSTMRGHGLEPPPIQRCVDNRGLTSDARLTMMAALDDEIKHLQQEIEVADEQRRQLQAAVENQQKAGQ